jgi:hypothetical protein
MKDDIYEKFMLLIPWPSIKKINRYDESKMDSQKQFRNKTMGSIFWKNITCNHNQCVIICHDPKDEMVFNPMIILIDGIPHLVKHNFVNINRSIAIPKP